MKKSLFKFPSIGQFRNAVYNVNYHSIDRVIQFEKTVKIHGSNASIVIPLWGDTAIYAQSRNNIITPEKDNAGFARWVEDNREVLTNQLGEHVSDILGNWDNETHAAAYGEWREQGIQKNVADILGNWDNETHVVVYGEWCGQGIQKNVAVNQLPKMFVVFGYRVVYENDLAHPRTYSGSVSSYEDEPLDFSNHDIGLYNIHEFGSEIITINFDNLTEVQNKLEADAEEVGRQCPVGTYFGVEGPGEGHVYNAISYPLNFKMKSDAHKVSNKATFTPEDLSQINSISELVDTILLKPRLEQGIEYLKEMHIPDNKFESIGEYISWVISDVIKEESDIILETGLPVKLVNKEIAKRARDYFTSHVNNIAFEK